MGLFEPGFLVEKIARGLTCSFGHAVITALLCKVYSKEGAITKDVHFFHQFDGHKVFVIAPSSDRKYSASKRKFSALVFAIAPSCGRKYLG